MMPRTAPIKTCSKEDGKLVQTGDASIPSAIASGIGGLSALGIGAVMQKRCRNADR